MSRATPQSLIQLAFDRSPDKDTAVAELVKSASSSATLRDYLILKGAQAAIGERIRGDNAKIFQDRPDAEIAAHHVRLVMPEAPLVSARHKNRIRSVAATLQLMAITLPNGVRMSNARKADIAHAVSVYEPQAADMLHKAAYYKAVMLGLPEGKTVSDVFDDNSLTALYEAARVSKIKPTRDAA
jgi:hypothetical protein